MASTITRQSSIYTCRRPQHSTKFVQCPSINSTHPRKTLGLPSRQQAPSRPFVTLPLQTLTATRTLPYAAKLIYELIADIPAYPSFIPYCTSSVVSSFSLPETRISHRRWPRTANLHIGYGPYQEVYRSRVYCAPYAVLEAVAGDAEPTIGKDGLGHYHGDDGGGEAGAVTTGKKGEGHRKEGSENADTGKTSSIFSSLLTRWTFKESPLQTSSALGGHGGGMEPAIGVQTEVNLVIEVRFASPVYSALSQAVAPKVAGMMVEAFEKRAKEVLGTDGEEQERRGERVNGVSGGHS